MRIRTLVAVSVILASACSVARPADPDAPRLESFDVGARRAPFARVERREGGWVVAGTILVSRDSTLAERRMTVEGFDDAGACVFAAEAIAHSAPISPIARSPRTASFAIPLPASAAGTRLRLVNNK